MNNFNNHKDNFIDLHSNMVKFKSGGVDVQATCIYIYIPIWLNSNIKANVYLAKRK